MSVRNERISRLWWLGGIFLLVCLYYVIRLAGLELNAENIGGHKQDGTVSRTVVVQAVRGQIYDRNGVPLVVNEYTYHLTMDYSVLPTDMESRNSAILQALRMLETCGETEKFCTYEFPFEGHYPNLTYRAAASDPESGAFDTLLEVVDVISEGAGIPEGMLPKYLVGMAVSSVVGYCSIKLVNLLASKGKFGAFSYYCWGAGVVSLIAYFAGFRFGLV